jgi:hypothetical protein
MENTFFLNRNSRVFTVRLMWDIAQPFVCGTLPEVVKYALQPNNGIEGFYEITGRKIRKVSKEELKKLLSQSAEKTELREQLFKKF